MASYYICVRFPLAWLTEMGPEDMDALEGEEHVFYVTDQPPVAKSLPGMFQHFRPETVPWDASKPRHDLIQIPEAGEAGSLPDPAYRVVDGNKLSTRQRAEWDSTIASLDAAALNLRRGGGGGSATSREGCLLALEYAQAMAWDDVIRDFQGLPERLRTERQPVEAAGSAEGAAEADTTWFSCSGLAQLSGLSVRQTEALRKRLERYRRTHDEGYVEVANRKPRQPQFLYRLGDIRDIIEDMKASGETPS